MVKTYNFNQFGFDWHTAIQLGSISEDSGHKDCGLRLAVKKEVKANCKFCAEFLGFTKKPIDPLLVTLKKNCKFGAEILGFTKNLLVHC